MTLWLYLHFPCLQLDSLYQQGLEKIAPVSIIDEKKNEIVQLSRTAYEEGVRVGMGLGSASSLCHNLQVRPYHEHAEHLALKQIARRLYLLNADITLYQPNGLLLKVSNMLAIYKSLASYWQKLKSHIEQLNVHLNYASAYSPFAARLLARQQLNQVADDEAWIKEQLVQQPISLCDLSPKVIESLQKVGIQKLGDLLSLPLAELAKRFDAQVVNYIGKLSGHIQHYVQCYIPTTLFEQYLELYYEVVNFLQLEKPLTKLYLQLENHLKLQDKLAAEITLILHQHEDLYIQLAVVAAQGEYKASKWLQLTMLNLESVTLNQPIVGITIKVKHLANKYAQRKDLFSGAKGQITPQELTSILVAKLGKDKVSGLKVSQDERPELANQLCQPFTCNTHNLAEYKLRPSLLLPMPQPLKEQVTVMSAPERIVTGWWDGHHVVRDYFIARSNQGRWLWLFKERNNQWFVHGVFS